MILMHFLPGDRSRTTGINKWSPLFGFVHTLRYTVVDGFGHFIAVHKDIVVSFRAKAF